MHTSFSRQSRRFTGPAAALAGAAGVLLTLAILATSGWAASSDIVPRTRQAADVARGEYLVNSVAMCVQCHSPRDQRGVILEDEKLTGAPMPVRGPAWSSNWAYRTPAIAGLPGFTDEQIIMLLTEGHAGDRPSPMPPMPPFRMTREDAAAVVSYLRTR